ncbi:MAG: hypothetical protein PVI03_01515 [Candidatus Thorarchaeota archaeon]|jgi:hypothetical protein
MNQEQSPQERLKEAEKYLDLFDNSGWKLFIEGMKESLSHHKENAHLTAPDNDSWQKLRGTIDAMEAVINFEDYINMSIELIKEELDEETN